MIVKPTGNRIEGKIAKLIGERIAVPTVRLTRGLVTDKFHLLPCPPQGVGPDDLGWGACLAQIVSVHCNCVFCAIGLKDAPFHKAQGNLAFLSLDEDPGRTYGWLEDPSTALLLTCVIH